MEYAFGIFVLLKVHMLKGQCSLYVV